MAAFTHKTQPDAVPFRVWRDGRWKLVFAQTAEQAVGRVRGATRAERAYDRQHPRTDA